MVVRPDAEWRFTGERVLSLTGFDMNPVNNLLLSPEITLRPLFGLSEERLKRTAHAAAVESGVTLPDLSAYYRLYAPDYQLESLAAYLRGQPSVESAFVKPGVELPVWLPSLETSPNPPPTATPDLTSFQEYLGEAPRGIGACGAWTLAGGEGTGVKIIDVERAWRFSHEDLRENPGGVVGGIPTDDIFWRNHGTAVMGVLSGDPNSFGVTGICPRAIVKAVSGDDVPQGGGSAAAIRPAADMLDPGDIILIELQYPGPLSNFQTQGNQFGYIPVEWWPDNLEAIQYATGCGVLVVESGGNGSVSLDDSIYDTPPSPPGPFPSWWRNPFPRDQIDSGAIIVGAGTPPPGTHGVTTDPDRCRLPFSNFGSMFDAQGWGCHVATCGFGHFLNGEDEDFWYTLDFGGTSSAAPMVAGALACVQGILKAAGREPLTPSAARELLHTTGMPQQYDPSSPASRRIGNRPDLRQMVAAVLP